MKMKTSFLIVQLLFVIVVIAVIATHWRYIQKKEKFEDDPVYGIVNSDGNIKVNGKLLAAAQGHVFGESDIPDFNNNINLKGNNIVLNATTKIPNSTMLEFGADVPGKDESAGKIVYGGSWPDAGDKLNIVGAGTQREDRKVKIWDKICIDKHCLDKNDFAKVRNYDPNALASFKNDQILELGVGVSGKEFNAGKIRYGGDWYNGGDKLNIVGAGANSGNRKVKVWDQLCVGPNGPCVDENTWKKIIEMANKDAIQSGSVSADLNCQSGKPLSQTFPITFLPKFSVTPKVYVAFWNIDWCNNGKNLRARTYAKDITPTGFSLVVETWGDTSMWNLGANWLAFT